MLRCYGILTPKTYTKMSKIYGLFGAMTGKVADVVMSVRNGEQIVRKYQPVVSNPNTPGQIQARAKLKLMSQLSAVMAPVLAIPRVGSKSSRNIFVSTNYGNVSYAEETNTASINLVGVQLTRSVLPIGGFNSAAREQDGVHVNLVNDLIPADVSRVVYAMFAKGADDSLEYRGSGVSSSRGDGQAAFGAILPNENRSFVVYAYGIRDNTEYARVTFGNLATPTAENVAKLIASRTLLETDITLTKTTGIQMAAVSA